MEKDITFAAKISLLLIFYLFLSFFYQAITSIPTEGDSLAYHIPIAKSIIDGSVFFPSQAGFALGFYPGSAELLLSPFLLLHLPLNLYNIVGWLVLIVLCYKLSRIFLLSKELSIIYAVSITSVLAMVRLLTNQTIDIWLAVFFTGTLVLLKNPRSTLGYFFLLGVMTGFLIGSKFSAPMYLIFLIVLYGSKSVRLLTPVRLLVFAVPFVLFGVSWYIRNILLTGNPLYPQAIAGLPGNERFVLMEWVGWQTVFFYPNGVLLMVMALFSEYMLWILSPVILLWYLCNTKKKNTVYYQIKILGLLGLLSFIGFFFLPSTGNNIITYLRYLFPAFIPLILCVFLIGKEIKKLPIVLPIILMNSILIISFTSHQPKLFLLFLVGGGILLFKYDILLKYLK